MGRLKRITSIGIAISLLATTAMADITYIKAGVLINSKDGNLIKDAVITVEDDKILFSASRVHDPI